MSYIYALTDTWNSAPTTFVGIGLNVTDTASAAGSLLLDLQVGGASQFNVAKTGLVTLNPALTTGGVLSAGNNAFKTIQFGSTNFGSNGVAAIRDGEGVVVRGSTGFVWENNTNNPATGTIDLRLVRDAANNLAQRNGTNAQTFRVYNTYTDASNYERATLTHTATAFRIAVEGAGSGSAARFMLLRAAAIDWLSLGASGTTGGAIWNINSGGHFIAGTDNTYDIGASGASRPRNLYVAGRANIDGLTVGKGGQTAVADNTAFGFQALNSASLTGTQNVAIGNRAGESLTTGGSNVFVGHVAGQVLTTGSNSVGVGRLALASATTAGENTAVGQNAMLYYNTSNNTAVGHQALQGSSTVANNTGFNLTAVGYRALLNNTSGTENVAVGHQTLNQTTTGAANTAVGTNCLYYNTTGGNNTAVGLQALLNNTTASSNVAVGTNSLRYFDTSNNTAVGHQALQGSSTVANNTGAYNTAVGVAALQSTTSGNENSAVGYGALLSNTTGAYGTALGLYALRLNTTGSYNVAVGHSAGDVITTGGRNTIVGYGSDPSANNGTDQTVIGESLTGKGNDTAFIGGTNGAYNEKNVTTWETTSDARIKKNIVSNTSGLDIINQIQVRNFEYRAPDEITDLPVSAAIQQPGVQLGVIAQELQAVLPGCVTENSTGVLSVSTDPLVWYLINAVKELAAEVKALKGE
jgi:hypothetical protein